MKKKKYHRLKRVLDIMVSILALIVLSPIFVLVAILLKIENPIEKIFFCQKRIGRYGDIFKIYKFRSLKSNVPEYLPAKHFHDYNRFSTRIGRLLRNLSIDETPQFLNVLRGEMSIVGPRPLIKEEGEIHTLRLKNGVYDLRPGITGLAQINGGNKITNEEKLRWDKIYLEKESLPMDIWICIHTLIPLNKNNTARKKLLQKYYAWSKTVNEKGLEVYRS